MIKTIIIEDEKPAARKLERMLSLFPDLELVATINSVEEGVDFFQNNEHPDLIFSDIVLGDGLSFDIFEKIIFHELHGFSQIYSVVRAQSSNNAFQRFLHTDKIQPFNGELLAARLEWSSFCDEERRAKKRERKAEKLP